ncbi:undecaprenyl-phosphate glucose phosphotransferase [Anaerocolumna sp. AGMB13020]|uniref:undecaprenyl-phosphate glucose phosphotransferase n=1 Tax=Anaerocolumna sp. AGMB13020 TaxID=3081750 RepID=UPI0029532343|nr:undecaprenyl-phosphate glucose phosphotransferase [Anaerocolumna sp. AGMB13020]WOO38552.1 undecaprenyl-phosphate glucose phosphotransferase [Anaerocolumna sp. AGMB13020]
MIKDNEKTLNRINVVADGIILILAYILTYYLRFFTPLRYLVHFDPNAGYYDIFIYIRILYLLVPGYLVVYYICGLYSASPIQSKRLTMWNIFKANILGTLYFTFLLYATNESHYSRYLIFIFFVVNILLDLIYRLIVSAIQSAARKKGYNQKKVLLVGYSRAAQSYIDRLLANPHWGYAIYGILDDNVGSDTTYKGIKVIGSIEELSELLQMNKLDEIGITLSIDEYSKLSRIVNLCEKSGVHTKFIPDYQDLLPTIPYTEDLDGLPVINIRNVPLTNFVNRIMKRAVDIFGGIFALLLFSIPMIIVALIIKATSSGPIIFTQVRIGKHNKEFKMYKFRSMELQHESKEKKAWTTFNDPRVTKIGKFIRKTSIDELPQLFNVLKGEMSLVGPRPERPFFVEKFKEEIPRYMIKHQVQPGITGWAQINGFRGDTSIRKRIDCDLYYIENWTLGLDFKILFLTIFHGFVNKNAY